MAVVLRDVGWLVRDLHLMQGIAAITTFDKVLDEFFALFIKESVGRAYATDSQEKAEWNSLFSVVSGGMKF